jgi:hypothetical protein
MGNNGVVVMHSTEPVIFDAGIVGKGKVTSHYVTEEGKAMVRMLRSETRRH